MEMNQKLETEIIKALIKESEDEEYLEKIALWDCVADRATAHVS